MLRESILLIGAGGHARSCIDVIEQEGRYNIIGLLGLPHEVGSDVFGYSILGCDDDLPELCKKNSTVLITMGQIKTASHRIRVFDQLQRMGGCLPVIISPRAYVSPHAKIGEGSIVMHGAVINAGVRIGRNCIINSKALLEHDVEIADHCHISTASIINGGVKIGRGTFMGSGCHVRQSITIGDHCLIGMGQVVLVDCAEGCWLPARKELA